MANPLTFPQFVDTTDSEQRWQIFSAIASATAYDYQLSNYVAADKPGTIVIKDGATVIKTLTLSYDGSNNLTSVVRS